MNDQPGAQANFFPGGGALNLSGVLAALVTGLLPLGAGIATGWSFGRSALYTALTLAFFGLAIGYLASERLASWYVRRIGWFLVASGLVICAMHVVSGDPYIQPMAFTVPFVTAVINLRPLHAGLLGVAYIFLLGLGLALSGKHSPPGVLFPMAVYGAVMVFMYAVVRIAIDQSLARREADRLAGELARERDELARLATENARLAAENAHSATLAERNRIARELHDTIAQGLTALTMQLDAAQRAFDRDPERARARLVRAHTLARDTLVDVRRSVWTLAEQSLDARALGPGLEEQARRFSERTGLSASYQHSGPPIELAGERAAQVLRIVQEALQNVEKHAGAGRVELGSRRTNGKLEVWVCDDGAGFDPNQPPASPGGAGFGLSSLRERARLAGAELTIESAIARGTTVRITLAGPA